MANNFDLLKVTKMTSNLLKVSKQLYKKQSFKDQPSKKQLYKKKIC